MVVYGIRTENNITVICIFFVFSAPSVLVAERWTLIKLINFHRIFGIFFFFFLGGGFTLTAVVPLLFVVVFFSSLNFFFHCFPDM